MADDKKGSETATEEELAKLLSSLAPARLTDLHFRLHDVISKESQVELQSLVENAWLNFEMSQLRAASKAALAWRSTSCHWTPLAALACSVTPQEAAEGEPNAESQLEAVRNVLEEAAARVSEELKMAEQVRAQFEEVDEIIQRLARDREEINSLKEETRSNISELQRMIAA